MPRESLRVRKPGDGELPDGDLRYFSKGVWLSEGRLSKITSAVRDFVGYFEGMFGRGTFECAQMLCCEVYGFNVQRISPEGIIKSYARRTADEIIRKKTIHAVVRDEQWRVPEDFPQVDGCQEQSLAAVTVLRAAGFPAAFVRWRHHSVALFRLEGETYLVNRWAMLPGEERTDLVRPILPAETRRLDADQRKGLCRIGVDPEDVGMKSIDDFWVSMGKTGLKQQEKFRKKYGT